MKCSNCPSEAVYVYEGSGIKDTPYCVPCLPSFLKPRLKDQTLKTTEAYARIKNDVLESLAPEPVETSADEEVEESPSPTPRRRRSRSRITEDTSAEEQAEV